MTIQPSHPPGHFYSPVIDPEQLTERKDTIWDKVKKNVGVDFNDVSYKKLLLCMKTYLPGYAYLDILDKNGTNQGLFT